MAPLAPDQPIVVLVGFSAIGFSHTLEEDLGNAEKTG